MNQEEEFEKQVLKLNPQKQDLTVEILRTFKGFENFSDEKCGEIVETIKSLSIILYDYCFSEGNCAEIPILQTGQNKGANFKKKQAA
jgi:hypothetical protein